MNPKILVISVSTEGKGGIATVVSTFLNNDYLKSMFIIKHFSTSKPGSKFIKLTTTLYAMSIFPFVLLFNDFKLAHIHGGSVIRKSYYALWLSLFKIPTIYQNHAANIDLYYECSNGLKKYYLDFVFSLYDMRLCLGYFWVNTLERLTNYRWNILYNPVPNLNVTKVDTETCNFTFIGELSKRKGITDLLNAFAMNEVENARLLIAGNGDIAQLSYLCTELGISNKVEFLGWINNKQKLDLLARTDVVVLPSYAEGLPMSILEAMSAGLPVITTSVGAIGDAITNNVNGLIVEPGNISDIFLAINELASNPDKRIEFGIAAKNKFDDFFNEDIVARKLACYYSDLIDGGKR
ncbi:glycosyltransferase family 4 protein [Vibrio metoecus]|uniref:glycosyltransferase family 4 protein n=1 Tax=Vibrio metoecus TaxID=1481663 RepID=UPI0006D7F677|nr:glycosyltransferase family 4 protein [Vibrio metoecus]KQA21385.1 poly-gamma-glutamate biosynthesis protein [Vibrio metoecus]